MEVSRDGYGICITDRDGATLHLTVREALDLANWLADRQYDTWARRMRELTVREREEREREKGETR